MNEVYATLHPEDQHFDKKSDDLNFPVKMLGSDSMLDKAVCASDKFPNIKLVNFKQKTKAYYANICPYCGAFWGKYYLECAVTDSYLKGNKPMDLYCEI